ncbi:MAG TPA: hypothetical protein VFO83_05875 [Aggregicoccus sp.]|nr:hypothetical protein [Aggregicoccus sp.]
MRARLPTASLALLLCLLRPGVVRAEEPSPPAERWGVLLSAGAGLFAGSSASSRGHLLSAHLLVATPFGLELGLVLQRGRTFETYPVDPTSVGDEESRYVPWGAFHGAGVEARYRFLRTRRVSPWVALRMGQSTSTKIDTDASVPSRYTSSHLAVAAGLGADVRIRGPFGVTVGGYFQSCDVNWKPHYAFCSGAGATLVLSPRLRF